MTSLLDQPEHDERPAGRHGLPPIGLWWPMLERACIAGRMHAVDWD